MKTLFKKLSTKNGAYAKIPFNNAAFALADML